MAVLKSLNRVFLSAAVAALPLLLSSCLQEFDPHLQEKHVVCLNSTACAGDTLTASVTRTWSWTEGDPRYGTLDIVLRDADVRLYVNGEYRETLLYAERPQEDDSARPWRGFRSNYVPRPGDEIRITVSDAVYGEAEGEVSVPYPVEIEDVEVLELSRSESRWQDKVMYDGQFSLTAWFSDPADTLNYYLVKVGSRDDMVDGEDDSLTVSFHADFVDPLFYEFLSTLDAMFSEKSGYTMFTDRQIPGRHYPLKIRLNNVQYEIWTDMGPESNASTIELTLYSLSEGYYRHMLSVWSTNDGINGVLGNIGLSDPIWEVSNVSTGAGMVAARSASTVSIKYSSLFGLDPQH